MASRNGLNPKIRGQKGIGFNRALPAPFGFDKGFVGDGNDDYFTVPKLVGVDMPLQFTVEFWVKLNATFLDNFDASGGYFGIQDTELKTFYLSIGNNAQKGFSARTPNAGIGNPPNQLMLNTKNHIVITFDIVNNLVSETINGNLAQKTTNPAGAYIQQAIREVRIYSNIVQYCATLPVDEFRLYNRIINNMEITTNYNGGLGFNASTTDGMLFWYKFEQFESLDFSALHDGSDFRTGIRDISGKNNHALPQGNIVTNPALSTYTLKPF
jgi:hypothetical protein